MNPKTKEAIAEVLEDLDLRLKFNRDEALAKICAIVDKEREGEVVLVNGEITKASIPGFYHLNGMYAFKSTELEGHVGKRGRLVFIPEEKP